MSFLQRRQPAAGGSNGALPPDQETKLQYPALFEYLTAATYPDGSQRQTSSLTLFSEDGLFKACLSDRDQGLNLFVSETKLLACFEALELLLGDDNTPWRVARAKGKPKGPGGR